MRQVTNGQAVSEWFQLLQQVDPTPLPSPLPPPPHLPDPDWPRPSGVHTYADFPPAHLACWWGPLGRQPNWSSCLDALALLPYSRATPQSLLPFHSIPRFQFWWPLTIASVVFTNTQWFTTENVRLFKTVYPSIVHSQSKYKEKEEKTRYIKYMYILCTMYRKRLWCKGEMLLGEFRL